MRASRIPPMARARSPRDARVGYPGGEPSPPDRGGALDRGKPLAASCYPQATRAIYPGSAPARLDRWGGGPLCAGRTGVARSRRIVSGASRIPRNASRIPRWALATW